MFLTTPSAPQRNGTIFLLAQPPLLWRRGVRTSFCIPLLQRRGGRGINKNGAKPRLPPRTGWSDISKSDFDLHECHAFGDYDYRDETGAQKVAEIINGFVIDPVDAEREAMLGFL